MDAKKTYAVVLPMGTKLIAVEKFGVSAFTATGRIKALEPTGGQKEYFIKVRGPIGCWVPIVLLDKADGLFIQFIGCLW